MRSPFLSPARRGALALTVLAAWSGCKTTGAEKPGASVQATPAAAKSARIEADQAGLVAALVRKHGEPSRARAERGIRQESAYWRGGDGAGLAVGGLREVRFV